MFGFLRRSIPKSPPPVYENPNVVAARAQMLRGLTWTELGVTQRESGTELSIDYVSDDRRFRLFVDHEALARIEAGGGHRELPVGHLVYLGKRPLDQPGDWVTISEEAVETPLGRGHILEHQVYWPTPCSN